MNALDYAVKQWLFDNPYDHNDPSTLPAGWEIRFGKRGRFLKYDSVEHAEQKNMHYHRELKKYVPFGYVNAEWEVLKANLRDGDELWRHGSSDGEVIYLIRDGKPFEETVNGYQHPKRGYCLLLSCY